MPSYIGPKDSAGIKVVFDAELPDVVAGQKAGRDNDEQRIICQLVGMGSPDVTAATLAYERIMAADEEITMIDMMG